MSKMIITQGAIHSTKLSGNFGPKLNGSVQPNRKSFEKTGPPFEVVLFSRSDRLEFWLNGSRPHSPPCAHSYPLFNKFKILNIFNIYKYQVSCFVFFHMQKLLPSPLSSLFVLNYDCHQYLTRQKDNLHVHTHKYSFSLRVQRPQIWNGILLSLRNSLTLSSYKHKLRGHFQSL